MKTKIKTVYDKVAEDIATLPVIFERERALCAACGDLRFLRYGCCLDCARVVAADDLRIEGYPRVGGKEGQG